MLFQALQSVDVFLWILLHANQRNRFSLYPKLLESFFSLHWTSAHQPFQKQTCIPLWIYFFLLFHLTMQAVRYWILNKLIQTSPHDYFAPNQFIQLTLRVLYLQYHSNLCRSNKRWGVILGKENPVVGFCRFCWASVCVGSLHHLRGEILSFSQQSSAPAWEEQKCILEQAAKTLGKCNRTSASRLFPEVFSSVLPLFSKPWRWTSPCTVITSKLIYYRKGKKSQKSQGVRSERHLCILDIYARWLLNTFNTTS